MTGTPPIHAPEPLVTRIPTGWSVVAPCSCGEQFLGEDITRTRAQDVAVLARRAHIAEHVKDDK